MDELCKSLELLEMVLHNPELDEILQKEGKMINWDQLAKLKADCEARGNGSEE